MKTSTDSIDWNLSVELANKNIDLAKQLLVILTDDLPKALIEMEHSFLSNDIETLGNQIHKLRGAASYCGVPRLQSILKHFSEAINDNKADEYKNLLSELTHEIKRILSNYQKQHQHFASEQE